MDSKMKKNVFLFFIITSSICVVFTWNSDSEDSEEIETGNGLGCNSRVSGECTDNGCTAAGGYCEYVGDPPNNGCVCRL